MSEQDYRLIVLFVGHRTLCVHVLRIPQKNGRLCTYAPLHAETAMSRQPCLQSGIKP